MNRKQAAQVRANITRLLEMPAELGDDLPYVYWVGQQWLCLENHRGIVEYTHERVRMDTSAGVLCISGLSLTVKHMGTDEVVILGEIHGAAFEQTGGMA